MERERLADRVAGPRPGAEAPAAVKAHRFAPRPIGGAVQDSVWLVQTVTRLGNRRP